AVAGLAADALGDVDRVVEVDVVGQVVDLDPLDRLARPPALADGLELGRLVPDLRVAVHAGLGRRGVRVGGLLDAGVAIAAIDAHRSGVVLVGELDGLDASDVLLRHVRRSVDGVEEPEQQRHEEDETEDRDTRDGVRTAMEDLSHGRVGRNIFHPRWRPVMVRITPGIPGETRGSRTGDLASGRGVGRSVDPGSLSQSEAAGPGRRLAGCPEDDGRAGLRVGEGWARGPAPEARGSARFLPRRVRGEPGRDRPRALELPDLPLPAAERDARPLDVFEA